MTKELQNEILMEMNLSEMSDFMLRKYNECGTGVFFEIPHKKVNGECFVLRLYFYKEEECE